MKSAAITLILLASQIAMAHVEPGKYLGKTPDGQECSMLAKETYFENNARHPLNERIKITVNGSEFTVAHPPIIDAAKAIAFFNHDAFHGVLPTEGGARALVITMTHDQGKEGPVSFTLIENQWRERKKESLVCRDLALVK